jgi:glycosyltransferase involved in cell wall biosynthesis
MSMIPTSQYPRISIITPSYNQGHFIEETIRSIVSQGYPNLEYIIIDGGSTDNTIDVIQQYGSQIAYWVSEPDRGQTHAINKGLAISTGEIWSYLNSDDLLCPGALHTIAEQFQNPEIDWVGGISKIFDPQGDRGCIHPQTPISMKDYFTPWQRAQQYVVPCSNVSFMRRRVLDRCGYFDEQYDYSMDIEYYNRAIFQGNIQLHVIPKVLGRWRWHTESKTMQKGIAFGFRAEEILIAERYKQYLNADEQQQLEAELRIQSKWVTLRKANFYKQQGEKGRSWQELISGLKQYPSLLWFRPWVSFAGRLALNL